MSSAENNARKESWENMKRMLLVINPCAGTKRIVKYTAQVIEIFNRADYEVLVHITSGVGDAARIVREKAAELSLVVCAGGDGTFNEAVCGILDSGTQTPIGYIPCGSTNDFANSLKLPTNILTAAKQIAEGQPVQYDIGRFGKRYFSYVASFGAFTRTAYSTPQSVKNALGHMAYVLTGIQELTQIHKHHLRFEMEDQVVEGDFIFGAISNSTSVGGILTLNPQRVDMSDGQFELLLVRCPKDLMELGDCIRALQSQKYDSPLVTFLSTDKVDILAPESMPWTLDGEREDGHAAVHVQNLHNAITLMRKVPV